MMFCIYLKWVLLSNKKATAKRQWRPHTVVTELLLEAAQVQHHQRNNIGGSLELKIHRITEVMVSLWVAAMERSLLSRSSVDGQRATLRITINNPLQFTIFVDD